MVNAGGALVVVSFTATWCTPCQRIKPVSEGLAIEFSDAVFLKADGDENNETASSCDVSAMHTLQYLRDGEKIDEIIAASHQFLSNKKGY